MPASEGAATPALVADLDRCHPVCEPMAKA
jgi:hypothetical protein